MDLTPASSEKQKTRLTALPLLIVLFVISYCLLTKLVIEQDKTIDSQRSLIHLLFRDNLSLSRLRKRASSLPKSSVDHSGIAIEFANPSAKSSGKKAPSTQVQSDPSAQVQTNKDHSSQAQVQSPNKPGDQANAKTERKMRKAEKPVSPPVELTDPSDMRRVAFSI